ncbi:hypothetical protein ACQ4LE_007523 [Meloidogyne hapla]|uniref:Btz domain-containing protein n=1 Tax=Meloidogyne hapla TaxID=6305 RepID=A0A1I8C163_MELHA
MEDQTILSTQNNSSPEGKNLAEPPTIYDSSRSIYDTLFASRYTNDDDEYKRASVTISHEPICLSWGQQRSHFDESGPLYSRRNQEDGNDNNDGNVNRDRNRNWRHTPYWVGRRGRGNREGTWNDRRDYRR